MVLKNSNRSLKRIAFKNNYPKMKKVEFTIFFLTIKRIICKQLYRIFRFKNIF